MVQNKFNSMDENSFNVRFEAKYVCLYQGYSLCMMQKQQKSATSGYSGL